MVLTRCAEEKYPEVDSFVMVNVKQVGLYFEPCQRTFPG